MLSPAIASPSGSRLGRAMISAVASPLSTTQGSHNRALGTAARACMLYEGRSWTRTAPPYSTGRYTARHGALPPTASAGMPQRCTFSTSQQVFRSDGNDGNGKGKPEAGRGASSTTADSKDGKPSTSPSPAAMIAAKRKPRSAGAKHSLRRVAVIAQQQPGTSSSPGPSAPRTTGRDGERAASTDDEALSDTHRRSSTRSSPSRRAAQEAIDEAEDQEDFDSGSNVMSAVCMAESFDMERVMTILESQGFTLDPDGSGFESHEVVHARKWWTDPEQPENEAAWREVDLFVFESGTLVGWGLPVDDVDALATSHLVAAADDPFVALRETEALDFRRDASRETSAMRGDVVVLGTRHEAAEGDRLATTRAQIAFSSGLARSTKLAVLEQSFTEYFESTRRIPEILAGRKSGSGKGGGLGRISQKFILQKTGELLSLRAQLNHYRELTDALPDIFWDARAELGLEGYYEQVGRALDVGVRIKTLNQKMDYAQEIATVLREVSSERHGTRLEWIIIVLIAVEVVFELRRVYLDLQEGKSEKETVKEAVSN